MSGEVASDAFTLVGESMAWSCTVTVDGVGMVDGVGGVGSGERRMLAMEGTWLGGGISESLERAGVGKTLARQQFDSPARNTWAGLKRICAQSTIVAMSMKIFRSRRAVDRARRETRLVQEALGRGESVRSWEKKI